MTLGAKVTDERLFELVSIRERSVVSSEFPETYEIFEQNNPKGFGEYENVC
jgi:hypothetical protein